MKVSFRCATFETMFNNLQCTFGVGRGELVDVDRDDDCSRACSHST